MLATSFEQGEDASARFFREVRAETTTSFAMVLSDAGGHRFHWLCGPCGEESQVTRSKALAQTWADGHNAANHS